jgi:hypothetical protein
MIEIKYWTGIDDADAAIHERYEKGKKKGEKKRVQDQTQREKANETDSSY